MVVSCSMSIVKTAAWGSAALLQVFWNQILFDLLNSVWILMVRNSIILVAAWFHNALMRFPGIFFMNLVCRDEARRNSVTEMLRESFASVQVKKIKGEVNEIIICHPSTPSLSKASVGRKSSKKWFFLFRNERNLKDGTAALHFVWKQMYYNRNEKVLY